MECKNDGNGYGGTGGNREKIKEGWSGWIVGRQDPNFIFYFISRLMQKVNE